MEGLGSPQPTIANAVVNESLSPRRMVMLTNGSNQFFVLRAAVCGKQG
jgi:hypothetical protein